MIRLARLSDLEEIAKFDPFSGNREKEISEHRCVVVERERDVVGYLSWLPDGFVGNPYISYLSVKKSARRQGHATALMDAAARRLPPCKLFTSTEDDNHAMMRLLELNGWTFSGCIEDANKNGIGERFYRKLT